MPDSVHTVLPGCRQGTPTNSTWEAIIPYCAGYYYPPAVYSGPAPRLCSPALKRRGEDSFDILGGPAPRYEQCMTFITEVEIRDEINDSYDSSNIPDYITAVLTLLQETGLKQGVSVPRIRA